jgi:hypothetical protein
MNPRGACLSLLSTKDKSIMHKIGWKRWSSTYEKNRTDHMPGRLSVTTQPLKWLWVRPFTRNSIVRYCRRVPASASLIRVNRINQVLTASWNLQSHNFSMIWPPWYYRLRQTKTIRGYAALMSNASAAVLSSCFMGIPLKNKQATDIRAEDSQLVDPSNIWSQCELFSTLNKDVMSFLNKPISSTLYHFQGLTG